MATEKNQTNRAAGLKGLVFIGLTLTLLFCNSHSSHAITIATTQSSSTSSNTDPTLETSNTGDTTKTKWVLPLLGKPNTPIDPTDPTDPTTPEDPSDDDTTETDQLVEIVLNQSLLDTIATDIIPAVADGFGLNEVQTLDDKVENTDIGSCHPDATIKIHDIKVNLPVSEDTLKANFASGNKLETAWDFSDSSSLTAQLTLDAPRTSVGGDCTILEWILLGDLHITGDISVKGITADADFSFKGQNQKLQVKTVDTFSVNADEIKVEIDDLDGGGILKVLNDAGIGIKTKGFSCPTHSSFEACLETWAQDQIIASIEGDDVNKNLKDVINSALDTALAIENSANVTGKNGVDYSFSLASLAMTPDNASLITKWNASLTDTGADDSCANGLTYTKNMAVLTTYDDVGSVDSYLPLWLVNQASYFIGKWGYFCTNNSSSTSVSGVNVSYSVAIKPVGEISLSNPNMSKSISLTKGILQHTQPTDQTAPDISSTSNLKVTHTVNIGSITKQTSSTSDTAATLPSKFTGTITKQSGFGNLATEASNLNLGVPVSVTFTGNVSGTATGQLSAKAEIVLNDTQGLSMKITSVAISNLVGNVTVSIYGHNKTMNINDLDLTAQLDAAFQGAFDGLSVALLPQVMDLNTDLDLSLSVGEVSLTDNAAFKIPLILTSGN